MMLSTSSLAVLRRAQEAHMHDVCYIQSPAEVINSFRESVSNWVDVIPSVPCGLDMRPGSERHTNLNTQVQYDATVRLPTAISVDAKARIKVVEYFGETLNPPFIFDVVSPPQRGPSCIRLILRRVET